MMFGISTQGENRSKGLQLPENVHMVPQVFVRHSYFFTLSHSKGYIERGCCPSQVEHPQHAPSKSTHRGRGVSNIPKGCRPSPSTMWTAAPLWSRRSPFKERIGNRYLHRPHGYRMHMIFDRCPYMDFAPCISLPVLGPTGSPHPRSHPW